MHPCPGTWVAVGRAVVYYMYGLPRHLVQEIHVGTVSTVRIFGICDKCYCFVVSRLTFHYPVVSGVRKPYHLVKAPPHATGTMDQV